MSTNGQLVFTDVDKITFKGVGNTSNAVVDTVTGKIGVGIDNPDANLHVLGNSYVSTNLELGGTLIMGTVNVSAHHSLEAVTAEGNTTPLTVEFSNATTGIVTTGNVEVGGELTVSGNATVSSNLTVSGHALPETLAPRYYTSIKTGKFTGASNPILTGFDNVGDGHSEPMAWEVHINFNTTSSSDIEVYMDGFYTSNAPTTHRAIVEHGTRRQRQDNSGTTWYHDKFYLGSYIAANHVPVYSVIRILNPHEQHSSITTYNTSTMRFHAWGETIYTVPGIGTTIDYAMGNLRADGANQRLHGIRLTPQSGTLTGAYTIFAIK